ncbi:MAG TPA: cbb3-type cytochrome c oxidase subunit I, partial [Planctomycetaceae bacterium]|nr:cbb3-type cytochrome c oxidase subunit I [Planctomycetaceae bacterium]
MSTLHPSLPEAADHGHGHGGHGHHDPGFVRKYIFSTDHKVIGIQFLITNLLMLMVGGALALGVRWQLAFPWHPMPLLGHAFAAEGGTIPPETYTMLFTMHATVMIFLVIIPILAGAFGNFLIPLMIGADDMAFPTLNMLSYWFMWPAIALFGASFFFGSGPAAGWTSYPTLSALPQAAPGSGMAQTLWLLAVTFIGVSSMMGSVNYMTTIINMRAPGMTFFRMPMTIWAMFITAILQAFALPVLTAAGFMVLGDKCFGTCFFIPKGLIVNNADPTIGGGQTLWLLGLIFVGISSMMGSVNYMTTIIQMRAPGMTMFRLPMTIWG